MLPIACRSLHDDSIVHKNTHFSNGTSYSNPGLLDIGQDYMKTLCDRYSRSGVWNTCIHKQRKSSLQRGRKPGACLNYAGFTRINAKIKHSVSVMCKFRAVARLCRSLSLLSSSLSEWLHGLIQSEIPN